MNYPALVVDRRKLFDNVAAMNKFCADGGVTMCAVTKCLCSIPELTAVYVEAGVMEFGDSRIENLKKISYAGARKWLLRIPMISEAAEVVKYADVSLNSELKTLERLSEEALKLKRRHKVVLMVDVGDLREGVLVENAVKYAGDILKLEGIELLGVGTNLNCFGGIIPTVENISELTGVAEGIEKKYGVELTVISGGNSGSLHLIRDKKMPERVNYIRVGEGLLFGHEASYQEPLDGMHSDIFKLHAEIVELKEKPSVPIGIAGLDAFGETPVFVEKGRMKRAIVACGRQDVSYEKIKPIDSQIEIIGSSSDHMIIDMTHADRDYQVGDIIEFSMNYAGLLSLCTSAYVSKVLV